MATFSLVIVIASYSGKVVHQEIYNCMLHCHAVADSGLDRPMALTTVLCKLHHNTIHTLFNRMQ